MDWWKPLCWIPLQLSGLDLGEESKPRSRRAECEYCVAELSTAGRHRIQLGIEYMLSNVFGASARRVSRGDRFRYKTMQTLTHINAQASLVKNEVSRVNADVADCEAVPRNSHIFQCERDWKCSGTYTVWRNV